MTTSITGGDWEPYVLGTAPLEEGAAGGAVHRLPAWARAQVDDQLFRFVEACPVGGRIRFETDADEVFLTVAATTVVIDGVEPAVTLVVEQGEQETEIRLDAPTLLVVAEEQVVEVRPRSPEVVRIPVSGSGPVDIWLPHGARVELVSLAAAAPVAAARRLGWNLRNLSLGGNAHLDGFVARVIRDHPADLITLKVGINVVNADSMRERTFRPALHSFLDTIREGQPDTPIVVISAISCPAHEDAAGPTVTGSEGLAHAAVRAVERDVGALTLGRTRDVLAEVVTARADPGLTFWDGRDLLGPAEEGMLYDGLHPDQRGLDLIAARFADGILARLPMARSR
ncbi:GDSL-type esterase/lipase family protein [Microbacterium algeriense]|uniref:GDSL-type esterase/lipase family protein n=1 Tax=Microbacterium algeriense TaxID=2615184 RepID=UPI000305A31C|nr:GDSL-type esterase/lipase family protein [Microbacterium barkeri]